MGGGRLSSRAVLPYGMPTRVIVIMAAAIFPPMNPESPGVGVESARGADMTLARLKVARRRLRLAQCGESFGAALLRAGALLVMAAGVLALGLERKPLPAALVLGALGWGILDFAVGVWRALRRWDLHAAAVELDRRGGTRDRFAVALVLRQAPAGAAGPVAHLALAECGAFIERFPLTQKTPLFPLATRRLFGAALAPLISLALLTAHEASRQSSRAAQGDPALDAAVAQRAEALQKLADQLRQTPDLAADAERFQAELKDAAQRLRDAASNPPDAEAARRAALGALSQLQARLQEMQDAARQSRPTPAEVAALAAALERDAATRAAGEALRAGDLAGAAEKLEKLLQQLKENGDPAKTLEQLARALGEAAAHLSQAERSELARQMQEAAQNGSTAQAMQRLAQLLRRAGAQASASGNGSNGAGSHGGRQLTAQEVQRLIEALENMKDGLRPGNGNGRPGGADGSGLVLQDFSNSESGKNSPGPAGSSASGMPGSERDTGTSEDIFGARDTAARTGKPSGPATRVQGVEGGENGESLDDLLLPATDGPGGGNARASQRYRALYDAMAPAAQEALRQEEIPPGARAYVGRYFRSIRPPE